MSFTKRSVGPSTNINTPFMVEKNVVSLTDRVDVDIVLRVLRMWNKWLHEEIGQVTLYMLDLHTR